MTSQEIKNTIVLYFMRSISRIEEQIGAELSEDAIESLNTAGRWKRNVKERQGEHTLHSFLGNIDGNRNWYLKAELIEYNDGTGFDLTITPVDKSAVWSNMPGARS
jgi:hypothetical protein